MSFVGIAFGAATLGRLADFFGRCRMLKIVTAFIIVCLYLTMIVENIVQIYILICIVGLTYNPRASTAYTFGCEYTQKKFHMKYAMACFGFFGFIQMLTGLFFAISKS